MQSLVTTKKKSWVSENNHSDLLNNVAKDISFENAEVDAVSIILSAIMGNITERWELPEDNRWSDVCPYCKAQEKDLINIRCTHVKHESEENQSKSLRNTSFSQLSEYLLSKKTTNSDNDIDKQVKDHEIDAERLSTISNKGSFKNNNLNLSDSQKSKQSSHLKSLVTTEQKSTFKSRFEDIQNKIYGWLLLDLGLEVVIIFRNGNRYEGKLRNCRMHGIGQFCWSDGSTYEGDFHHGEMTGEGCLEWSDQSWYEGQVHCGYRHGLGLYVQSPFFYCGNWSCGMRHGTGSMYYDQNNVERDYYSGEWVRDRKEGPGVRSYPSGAVYSGQWAEGGRNGLGTMVWTNNDVYSGNWETGRIQGYGEYSWSTFINKQLVVPQENCYYGNWEHGLRHGNGTLETNHGVIVHGTWRVGKKHGAAEVICSNGCFVYADNLFADNCVSPIPNLTEKDSHIDTVHSYQLYKIPVNAASQDIDLKFSIDQLNEYTIECKRLGKSLHRQLAENKFCSSYSSKTLKESETSPTKSCKVEYPDETFMRNEQEKNSMRNIINRSLSALKVVYKTYAEVCCETKPSFSPVMMRLMFWQLLRDCHLHNRGYSLADFDIMIANNKATLVQGVHYPFERLQFWQFLHCLIEISWQLYGRQLDGTHSVSGVLASAFHKLITTDILPNSGRHTGLALFKHKNLLSMDSVYWFYRGLGEPLTARQLLRNIFLPSESRSGRHTPQYPPHLIYGRNNIGVGGKLSYSPGEAPFLEKTKFTPDPVDPQDLTCLESIGLPAAVDCIINICPSVAFYGLVVNIDYQVVFLEFYEIFLSCARLKVRKTHPPTPKTSSILKPDAISKAARETAEDNNSLSTIKSTKSTKPIGKHKKKK